jgi:hypothetical protein
VRGVPLAGAIRRLQRFSRSGAVAAPHERTAVEPAPPGPRAQLSPRPEVETSVVIEKHTTPDALAVGWHPDPYRRWKARYWNGHRWTERVANPGDHGQPMFGTDVIVPSGGDVSAQMASVVLLQTLLTEFAILRSEAEKWRAIAEERAHALDRRDAALPPTEGARPTGPETTSWYRRFYDR